MASVGPLTGAADAPWTFKDLNNTEHSERNRLISPEIHRDIGSFT